MNTGERIKQARKNAGLSQKELGEKLEISPVMISQYENGVRNPKLKTLQKIADALGVLMSDLLTFNILSNTEKADIEDCVNSLDSESNVIQHFIYPQNHSTYVKFNKAPASNKVTYIPSDSLIPEPFMLLLSRTNEKRQASTVQSRPVFPQTAPGVILPCALTSI